MVILPKYLINLECGLEKCYYVQNKMKKGGGMMTVIRDTVLLPGLQYIGGQLQKGITDEFFESFDELLRICDVPEVENIFKSIRDWFSLYQKNPDAAKTELEIMMHNPLECRQCFSCQQCLPVFLEELYASLYESGGGERLKGRMKGDKYYVFSRFPDNLYRQLDARTKAGEYYWEQCKRFGKFKTVDNKLIVLKGMSSSTPAILNGAFGTQSYHGGGLYLNWFGFGIAIDPGYHFIENLHANGLSILDIDAVVITHEHIDHTNDIRILDDLNYNLSSYLRGSINEHKIKWYVDSVTYDMLRTLRQNGSGFSSRTNIIYEIKPREQEIAWEEKLAEITKPGCKRIPEEGIRITEDESALLKIEQTYHERNPVDAEGDEESFLKHTFAVAFELKKGKEKRKIFYSSDTSYRELLGKCVQGSDIVIVNISSVYEDDVLKIKQKKTHLGYMGCFKLLESMKDSPPSMFLISEFWNAKADIRFDITRYLKEEMMISFGNAFKKTKFIPAEIGMRADVLKLTMQCAVCRTYTDDFIITRPDKDYGEIRCICNDCFY